MQKSLAEKFNEIITAEHNAFPKELKKLVVLLLPSSKTPVFVAPEIAEHLTNNVAAVKEAVEERTNSLRKNNSDGVSNRNYFLGGKIVKIIALDEKPMNTYSLRYTEEMDITANLLHEIGHLIIKKGGPFATISQKHLSECTANVYTALRHIQLFGKETDFFEYYGNYASAIVLDTSPIHYTDDVLKKAKQLSEEIDISALSLPQTAELAEKIAQENKLSKRTLKKISSAFLPVKKAYEKAGGLDVTCLRKCVDIMQEHQEDSDIFMAGKRFLDDLEIQEYLKNEAKTDSYWKDALNFIENHQIKPVQIKPPKKKLLSRFSGFVMRGS